MSQRNRTSKTVLLQAQQPAAAKPKPRPPAIPPMVDEKYGPADGIMALPREKLIAILGDAGASVYAKAKACQALGMKGEEAAVPALAALLPDPQLSHYARYGLEPMPGPAADEALRAALGKVKGKLLAGVINSIGCRRDKQAIEALGKLVDDAGLEVARAAGDALARIRPML